MKRVVITGLGTINPLGNDVDTYWENLINGKSFMSKVDRFDITDYPCQVAALVKDFEPAEIFGKKEARKMARFMQFAVVAAREAVEDADLNIEKDAEQIGVIIGSGVGGIEILETAGTALSEKGPRKVSPFTVPLMIANMASGQVAIATGAKGYNSTAVTACASGSHSIGDAYSLIKNGKAIAMIAGGSEASVTPVAFAGFCAAKTMSTRDVDPDKASCPFTSDRDGFVMGEGSGIIILEELEHALARNAKIYAEVVGYGATGDAFHMTSPAVDGEGAARAIQIALDESGADLSEIDYINSHGTSTQLNDKYETMAIKTVFKEKAYDINISSTKSMTGHLLGAAGGIEAVALAKVVKEDICPPTINYDNPDELCDLNYTPNKSVKRNIRYAISNSLGFGGHNAVIIFKKYSK